MQLRASSIAKLQKPSALAFISPRFHFSHTIYCFHFTRLQSLSLSLPLSALHFNSYVFWLCFAVDEGLCFPTKAFLFWVWFMWDSFDIEWSYEAFRFLFSDFTANLWAIWFFLLCHPFFLIVPFTLLSLPQSSTFCCMPLLCIWLIFGYFWIYLFWCLVCFFVFFIVPARFWCRSKA